MENKANPTKKASVHPMGYWRKIVCDSWSAATDSQVFKARISEVGLRIVVAVLFGWVAAAFAAGVFLNSAWIGIITFVGLPFGALILGLTGSFMWNLFYQPAKLHQCQLDTINTRDGDITRLTNMYECDPLPFRLTPSRFKFNEWETNPFLKIDNPDQFPVEHTVVRLEKLFYIRENGQLDNLHISGDMGFIGILHMHENGVIRPRDHILVPIVIVDVLSNAQTCTAQPRYLNWNYNPDTHDASIYGKAKYRLEVLVRGQIGIRQIDPKIVRFELDLKNDDSGKSVDISNIEVLPYG